MKTWLHYLRQSLAITLIMLVLCGLAYPAVLTGLGQLLFPNQANGSLITAEGEKTQDVSKAVGSALVGQDFSGDARYFQGRVSSVHYNTYTKEQLESGKYKGVSSGNFNYGPVNPDLKERVQQDVTQFIKDNPAAKEGEIPADLFTASGSGLDPHITPQSAEIQIPSISKATGIRETELRKLVSENTEKKVLGIFGHERVNVLVCNLYIAKMLKQMERSMVYDHGNG